MLIIVHFLRHFKRLLSFKYTRVESFDFVKTQSIIKRLDEIVTVLNRAVVQSDYKKYSWHHYCTHVNQREHFITWYNNARLLSNIGLLVKFCLRVGKLYCLSYARYAQKPKRNLLLVKSNSAFGSAVVRVWLFDILLVACKSFFFDNVHSHV